MATLSSFFSLLILLLVAHTRLTTADDFMGSDFTCESTSCESGGISIEFPFWLRLSNQSHHHCGYPGFDLSCSNNTRTSFSQPLLTLPESGDFVVKLISLENQKVWINDPDECLPQRIIHNHGLSFEGSPFQLSDDYTLVKYSFLNCPPNVTSMVQPITCLNLSSSNNDNNKDINYSVVAVLSDHSFPSPWFSSCHLISSASIPVADRPWLVWNDYYSDILLQWVHPNCGSCVAGGGRCGFLGDTTSDVTCYDLPSQGQGLSRKAKSGISLGLGIPGLLGIIGFTCFICGKLNVRDQRRRASTGFSTLVMPRPPVVVMGLDGPSIERYPKTQLGESGRLPKPSDNICSICLCEYQPKEMLRTIPECNHYFHANCIDGWLKMNATCPLCRNLPDRSSLISPSFPSSPAS